MSSSKRGNRLSGYVPDYVVFDLETTGLSPNTDEIIEISAVKAEGGKVKETFSTLVNPGRPIPREASMVNGITDDMVAGAPKLPEAIKEFSEFIGKQVLVGHNIRSFDLKFLSKAFLKLYGKDLEND